MDKEYILFKLGDGWYAFPILAVAYPIVPVTTGAPEEGALQIQKLPLQKPELLGLANVHGEVCVLLSIENLLGIKHKRAESGLHEGLFFRHRNEFCYGFLLDQIPEIMTINEDDIEPAPSSFDDGSRALFKGVYQEHKGRLFGILDKDRLVDQLVIETPNEKTGSD